MSDYADAAAAAAGAAYSGASGSDGGALPILLELLGGVTHTLLQLGFALACLAALVLLLVFVFQRRLLYVPVIPGQPAKTYQYTPNDFNMYYRDVPITAADGVKTHGWLCRSKQYTVLRSPVTIFFQENAGNISHRLPFAQMLCATVPSVVFLLSYRGYGASEGTPSQKGIELDAQACIDTVSDQPDVDGNSIVLFGRSLGGAVAVAMALKNPRRIRAVILENTFTSISEMAGKVFPFLRPVVGPGQPLNSLVRERWESLARLKEYFGDESSDEAKAFPPCLCLVSAQDEMVPPEMMERLYASIRSPRKHIVTFAQARHMDAYVRHRDQYWSTVKDFYLR